MKCLVTFCIASALAAGWSAGQESGDPWLEPKRVWKNGEGKELEARLVAIESKLLVLDTGKLDRLGKPAYLKVKPSAFTEADIAYARGVVEKWKRYCGWAAREHYVPEPFLAELRQWSAIGALEGKRISLLGVVDEIRYAGGNDLGMEVEVRLTGGTKLYLRYLPAGTRYGIFLLNGNLYQMRVDTRKGKRVPHAIDKTLLEPGHEIMVSGVWDGKRGRFKDCREIPELKRREIMGLPALPPPPEPSLADQVAQLNSVLEQMRIDLHMMSLERPE